jgi:hypothetical protein
VNAEIALRNRLLATVGADAPAGDNLVDTRIFPHQRPQGSKLPAVTYFRAGEFRQDPLSHADALTLARIQYDAWAGSYEEVVDLALKVQRALKHYFAPPEVMAVWFDTQEQLQDGDPPTHRVRMDWDVWTMEA